MLTKRILTAFDFFSCGGGASLGIIQAGFNLLGFNEIDERMAKIHQDNIKTTFDYVCDIRDMLNMSLPQELYNLDLAHFSPPCSTFSMVGLRDKVWGKEKKFAEGQKKQKLDELLFVAIDMIAKLKPKVATIENVTGLIKGRAKIEYFDKAITQLQNIGYEVEYCVLNATTFDVPQNRERAFIIAQRKDIFKNYVRIQNKPKIIPFSTIMDDDRNANIPERLYYLWKSRISTDKSIADILVRIRKKRSNFSKKLQQRDKTLCTLTTHSDDVILYDIPRYLTINERIKASTFPVDYKFPRYTLNSVSYITGHCIPPKMMAGIAKQIREVVFEMFDL